MRGGPRPSGAGAFWAMARKGLDAAKIHPDIDSPVAELSLTGPCASKASRALVLAILDARVPRHRYAAATFDRFRSNLCYPDQKWPVALGGGGLALTAKLIAPVGLMNRGKACPPTTQCSSSSIKTRPVLMWIEEHSVAALIWSSLIRMACRHGICRGHRALFRNNFHPLSSHRVRLCPRMNAERRETRNLRCNKSCVISRFDWQMNCRLKFE